MSEIFTVSQVHNNLNKLASQAINSKNIKDAFFLFDTYTLDQIVKEWFKYLPNVVPFYAVKANNHPKIIKCLVDLGFGFDCASKLEIEQILSYGVHSSKIVFANPCKQVSHINFAKVNNVKLTVADNISELYKLKTHFPDCKILLRILADNCNSAFKFNIKFGIHKKNIIKFFKTVKLLELDLVGISFHVGSRTTDINSYKNTLQDAYEVFNQAKEFNFNLSIIDIGGGFPSHDLPNMSLKKLGILLEPFYSLFGTDVKFIAEPGRIFAETPFSLYVSIIAVNDGLNDSYYRYYINDGVYDSFANILSDQANPLPFVCIKQNPDSKKLYRSSVFGPTCDSLDLINSDIHLPILSIEDWLVYYDMGSYSMSCSSGFNGFQNSLCYIVHSKDLCYL